MRDPIRLRPPLIRLLIAGVLGVAVLAWIGPNGAEMGLAVEGAVLGIWLGAGRTDTVPESVLAFDSAFGSSPDPAVLTDLRGTIVAQNHLALQKSGAQPPQELGHILARGICATLPDPAATGQALQDTLIAEVARLGTARCPVGGPGGSAALLVARAFGPEHVLWLFDPLPVDADALVLVGPGGGPLWVSEGARTLAADGVQPCLARIGWSGPTGKLIDLRGAQWQALRLPLGLGEAIILVHSEDAPVLSPGAAADSTAPADIIANLPVALLQLGPTGMIEQANAAARELLGRQVLAGQHLDHLVEGLGHPIGGRIGDIAAGRLHKATEMARTQREGMDVYLQVSLMRMRAQSDGRLIAILTDKTELKTLEAQFVQSQKMQAVGQLAGGVAHDFNNLLTAITGHTDLLLLRYQSDDAGYGDLVQIRQNANRAAGLVRQLLAFSRKQTLRPRIVQVPDVLVELTHLLRRLLGEKVALDIRCGPDIAPVRVDDRQLEQVIMNLVVNARDAMPGGGTVTIRAEPACLAAPLMRNRATVPVGDYVLIRVSDTGTGIDPDKIDKVFEPFFTTKKPGEGTGLGLSTAYGIIKQTGGFIFADSIPGAGASFSVYLPAISAAQAVEATAPRPGPARPQPERSRQGRILLVEDEDPVRTFAARALRLRGYHVDEAESGEKALQLLGEAALPYDLFLSDVVMPGLDGPGWVANAQAQSGHTGTPVVFMSGYAEDVLGRSSGTVPEAAFLPKPFSLNDLTRMVAQATAD